MLNINLFSKTPASLFADRFLIILHNNFTIELKLSNKLNECGTFIHFSSKKHQN